jgi:RNA polymerase sigma-70 factor (ECF subfamily)
MSDRENPPRLDRFVWRYLQAIETGDLETVATLWAAAAEDPELEEVLHGINEALAATEEQPRDQPKIPRKPPGRKKRESFAGGSRLSREDRLMTPESEWPTEHHRRVLLGFAFRLCLDKRLRRRFDESDLVQDAVVKAIEKRDTFRGNQGNEAELLAWLHAILLNTFRDRVERELADKRDAGLERSIQDRMQQSSARLEALLEASQSSPSERLQKEERDLCLANALQKLPKDQREAVVLHYLLQMPVDEVAEQMQRTKKAVAGLIYRGMKDLEEDSSLRQFRPGSE